MIEYVLVFLIMALLAYIVVWAVDFVFFIPSLFIRNRKFACMRCGKCCRKIVPVTDGDIRLIEKHGHKKNDFVNGFGPFKTLRRRNGECVFLFFSGKKAGCRIYPYRPGVCRKFPFKKIFSAELKDWRCSSFRK